MEYTDEMREMQDFLESYKKKEYQGLVAAFSALEYAQWVDKIDFNQAKELMYRFIEHMIHPEWDED